MLTTLAVTVGTGLLLSYLLSPLCGWLARELGFMDRPGGHKTHDQPVALLGGISVGLSFWIVVGGLLAYGDLAPDRSLTGIFFGSIIIVAIGVLDDAYELSPWIKLIGQILVAGLLVVFGLSLSLFMGRNWITMGLTIGWLVLLMNSFNLLDNMNGLCAGVGSIASAMLGIVAAYQGQWELVYILGLFSAVLLGFLRYNVGDATIFLGDTGSGLVGFLLGSFSIMTTYASEAPLERLPVIVPGIIFAVPFYDTLTVILYRIRRNHPIMKGDNRHFSHRLTRIGMSEPAAVGLICLLTLSTGLLGTMLPRVDLPGALIIITHTLIVLAVILLLERVAMKHNETDT